MSTCRRCGHADNGPKDERCKVCGGPLGSTAGRATARTASGWRDTTGWRRHQLVRATDGKPIDLAVGTEVTFGRSRECQVHIMSNAVSRQHARIVWQEKRPVLRDLGSENGTEVNGRPVKEHVLASGDEIKVGPFVCTYREVQGAGSTREAEELLDSQADTQPIATAAMVGRIEDLSVYELLETLHFNRKTGTLELYDRQDREGKVLLRDGEAIYAAAGERKGEAALFHLIDWSSGNYRFLTELDEELKRNVRRPFQEVLAQASQQRPKPGDYQSG